MPSENTTTHFALPFPSETGEAKLGATDMGELAKKVDEVLWERLLNLSEGSGVLSLKSGELLKATGSTKATLPTPTANRIVGVLANNHEVELKAGSGLIYGDFVTGTTPINLVGYQHVVVVADGSNWYIIAGEPKREQTWTEQSWASGEVVTPSTTRPTLVKAYVKSLVGEGAYVELEIEGVVIDAAGSPKVTGEASWASVGAIVPAGQKVKITKDEGHAMFIHTLTQ